MMILYINIPYIFVYKYMIYYIYFYLELKFKHLSFSAPVSEYNQ